MLQLFLFIHVMTAIVAFGPTFALPLIARMGRMEPQHAVFALRVARTVQMRLVVPAALTMPVSGLAIVWAGQIDLASSRWLMVAIVLYVLAVGFAVGVQAPALGRMIELGPSMSTGAPAPRESGTAMASPRTAGAAQSRGAAAVQSGPPPEFLSLSQRVQRGSLLVGALIVAIVALMVTRPF